MFEPQTFSEQQVNDWDEVEIKNKKNVRGIKFEPQKNSSLDEFTETK